MDKDTASWTFFSNHGHVYFLLAIHEELVVREIAKLVGITERSILSILQDLEDSGYIERRKVGRSNKYKIIPNKTLRHSLESDVQLGDLVNLIKGVR